MKGKHSAIARGENGNLHMRHFETAADAAAASRHRELVPGAIVPLQPGESPNKYSYKQPSPELLRALPEILDTLRILDARKLRVTPAGAGAFEIEVLPTNRLYVSRRELAEMLPLFDANTDRQRYVDKLVELGLPHINATGSRLFNVPKCIAWLDENYGAGGGRVK